MQGREQTYEELKAENNKLAEQLIKAIAACHAMADRLPKQPQEHKDDDRNHLGRKRVE